MSDPSPIKILILTADPAQQTQQLRLDEEVREIETAIERSPHRHRFQIITKWAVRPQDIRRALLQHQPQIVHFSGHGSPSGLVLEKLGKRTTQVVNIQALAHLLQLSRQLNPQLNPQPSPLASVHCVVLNACHSQAQAQAIAPQIPVVIGMNQAIGDAAATQFASGFYDALGAGRSYTQAYHFGCNAINLYNSTEDRIPILLAQSEIYPLHLTPEFVITAPYPWRKRLIRVSLSIMGLAVLYLGSGALAIGLTQQGWSNHQAHNAARALTYYRMALILRPQAGTTHLNMGLLYEDWQDPSNIEKAKHHYRRAIEAGIAIAYNNLARLYLIENQYDIAENLLHQALQTQKQLEFDTETQQSLYKNLGWIALERGNFATAESYLTQAIHLQPQVNPQQPWASPHCLLAQTLEGLNQPHQAIPEWTTCMTAANPTIPEELQWSIIASQRLEALEIKALEKQP